jgi:hypothetical protein
MSGRISVRFVDFIAGLSEIARARCIGEVVSSATSSASRHPRRRASCCPSVAARICPAVKTSEPFRATGVTSLRDEQIE